MDLRALKTFQTIVKVGSFQQAAHELQYVQSTVTMQIKKLESDLGVTLFHRGKKLTLTEAGLLLLKHATPLLHNVDIVEQAMREVANGRAGVVRVGCIEPTSNKRLPQLVSAFCSSRPNVTLTVDVSSTGSLTERVIAGELDFAICSLPDFADKYQFHPLFSEPLSLIIPASHPLAEQESIQLTDLQGERLLYCSPSCVYRRRLDTALQQLDQFLTKTMEITTSYELMIQLVIEGLGVAFAPTVYIDTAPDKLVSRNLKNISFDVSIGLLTRSEGPPLGNAASSFFDYIKENITL